jgi:holo-[acyl-carrier protein] synthase
MYPVVRPTWKEITYNGLSPMGRKPLVEYHPTSPDLRNKIGRTHVSVSHDGDYVSSTVLVEGTVLHNIELLELTTLLEP